MYHLQVRSAIITVKTHLPVFCLCCVFTCTHSRFPKLFEFKHPVDALIQQAEVKREMRYTRANVRLRLSVNKVICTKQQPLPAFVMSLKWVFKLAKMSRGPKFNSFQP